VELAADRTTEPSEANAARRAARQLGLIWGAVALALVLVSPLGDRLASTLPSCPVKTYADLPCPGCGTTRAALALGSFDVLSALRVSPLATLGWIGFILGGFIAGAAAIVGRPFREPSWNWPLSVRLAIVAVVVANWFYLVWAGT